MNCLFSPEVIESDKNMLIFNITSILVTFRGKAIFDPDMVFKITENEFVGGSHI